MEFITLILSITVWNTIIHVVMCNGNYREVNQCPMNRNASIVRDYHIRCTINDLSYHCLRKVGGGLIELCMKSLALDEKDGCPTIRIEDGNLFIDQVECYGQIPDCPDPLSSDTFSSKDTYKYPACFWIKSTSSGKRTPSGTVPVEHQTSTGIYILETAEKVTNLGTKSKEGNDFTQSGGRDNSMILIGVIGTVILAILFTVIGLLFKHIRKLKMGEMRYMTSVPYNSGTSHVYHDTDTVYDEIAESEQSFPDKGDSCPEMTKENKCNVDESLKSEKDIDTKNDYLEPVVTMVPNATSVSMEMKT